MLSTLVGTSETTRLLSNNNNNNNNNNNFHPNSFEDPTGSLGS
jgi:hypothetical protein